MNKLRLTLIGTLVLTLLGLPAASNAAQAVTTTYEVTVTNITNSMQGLSPLALAAHPPSADAWQMGQPASPGLVLLAEEGMPDMLANEWRAAANDVATTKAHLFPGDSISVMVTAREGDVLSAATMLIQTNDGFTGLDGVALRDGATYDAMAYDAGSEENTERKADVPGPPLGGKNSGPASAQPVSMHDGIKGTGDVTPEFKWTGPVARFTVRAVDTTPPELPTYEVTVTNITNSMQGLSPIAFATHPASTHAWRLGQPSSKGLEILAEEGMTDMLAGEWRSLATDVVTTKAHLLPGDSITIRITARPGDVLSAATMLIQTNDGFTGVHNATLDESTLDMMAYDAGTEPNTERKADVPGPPFGGKNSGPTSADPIAMHEGIKGTGDVTPEFNWSGPVARINITGVAFISNPMPGMPATGIAGTGLWTGALVAWALLLIGLLLRQALVLKRR